MNDRDRRPTTREWLRALVVVAVVAALVTAFIVWFAVTFLFQSCCVSPGA